MPSELDESDLYPPDAEDRDLTPEAKNHRMRAAVGATLLTWGMSLIVQLALGIDIDTFVLGIGVGALAGWSQLRRYHWFAVGSIAVGLGAAEVMGAVVGGAFGSAVAALLVAAGFAAIYVRYPRRSMWALVPAAIMALIAAGAFGVGLIGLLPAVLGKFLLPLLLVGGGGLLLFRHSLPPKTVKIGLAALAATFVLVGANSVPDIDPDPQLNLELPQGGGAQRFGLPSLEGRTLVLVGDAGNVTLETAEDGRSEVVSLNRRQLGPPVLGFDVDVSDPDQVVVTTSVRGDERVRDEPDLLVRVPEGTDLEVERRSGSISGRVVGGKGTFETESGEIRLTVQEGGAEGYDDDGPHEFRTDSGSIRVDATAPLVLDVMTDSGVIRIGDEEVDGDDYESPSDLRGIDVEIDSETGPIRVDLGTASPTAPMAPMAPIAPTAPSAPASSD